MTGPGRSDDITQEERLRRRQRIMRPITDFVEAPSQLPGLRTARAWLATSTFRRFGMASPGLLMAATAIMVLSCAWSIGHLLPLGLPLWLTTIAVTWTLVGVGLGASGDCTNAMVERALRRAQENEARDNET